MIFKDRPTNELLNLFDSVNLSIDEIILWVEENIPSEYNGVELARAYDLLSKTDVFRGRIHKQQYWRFLIYENIFLSYGIASSKKNFRTGFTGYKRPSRILRMIKEGGLGCRHCGRRNQNIFWSRCYCSHLGGWRLRTAR